MTDEKTPNQLVGRPYTSLVLDELQRAGLINLDDSRIEDLRILCDEIIGSCIREVCQRHPSASTMVLGRRLTSGAGETAVAMIFDELRKAEVKHPGWPTDPIHATAILCEESGEATQAAIDHVYADGSVEDLKTELAQTGAMALRALLHLIPQQEAPEHQKTCRACANCGIEPDSPYFICGAAFAGPLGLHVKQEPLPECGWKYFDQHPLRNPDGSLKSTSRP